MKSARFILRNVTRVAAFFGLAVWAVGSVVAGWLGNAEFVQRFGALGVAASVLFFSNRLAAIELGRQRSVEKLLHELGLEIAALKQGTDARDLPKEGYVVDFLTEERNFDGLRAKADAYNFFNVVLLTVATLQWGFGDRWVRALSACEGAVCP